MDQAPYRSMPASDTAALIRENRILRAMLRVIVATFVILAVVAFFIALAASSVRAEVGLAALLVLVTAIVIAGRALLGALLAFAAAMPAPREEIGVRVDASEPDALLPAPAATIESVRAALKEASAMVRGDPYDKGIRAHQQLLLAQLHELETTGRLAAKR